MWKFLYIEADGYGFNLVYICGIAMPSLYASTAFNEGLGNPAFL
jgi:hypothetical protein